MLCLVVRAIADLTVLRDDRHIDVPFISILALISCREAITICE